MLRSLFSGVSGMRNNQTKMDVIANNIANVSTTAFKAGRVRFQDILSQTVGNASSPTSQGRGGINPMQIGLGMQVAGIDTITNQGAPQPTGRPLDNCIDGEGYFIISDGTKQLFTRDGSFNFDANFNIVNSDGYKVMGYTSSGMLKTAFGDLSSSGTGINWLDPNATLTQNSDLTINGKTLKFTSGATASEIVDKINGSSIGVKAKLDSALGLILTPEPGVDSLSISGTGDFANMNINRTMQYSNLGVSQIVVKDNLTGVGGQDWSNPGSISPTGSDTITINGKKFDFTAGPSDPANGIFGVTTLQDVIDAINSQSDITGVKAELNGGLIFTPTGNTSNITISNGDGIFKGLDVNIDTLSGLNIPPVSPADPNVKINNFTIEANGTIKGIYEDGSVVALGKIALAKFANPAGLLKAGGNNYTVSANSGIADIGSASVGGRGDILQSLLEMSNVDLANEFTDMIITSRAFQANSRSITTSDEMLQELLNLKR